MSSTDVVPMVAVRGARLFDGERLAAEPVVVLQGDRIVDAGVAAPAGVEVRDLGDVTLLPGLVDAHQHLVFDGRGPLEQQVADRTDDELRERARANARRALRAGITTIRDLGDRGFVTLDVRDDPELPTILASGPPLTAVGGHCWFLGGSCRDTQALVDAVKERKQRGCDVVKIMVTGGAHTPTFPMWASQFTDEDIAAVVALSHSVGLPVAAHCHGVHGTNQAITAGADTIEHCSFFTADGGVTADPALLERLARSGVAVSATCGRLPSHPMPPMIEANLPLIEDALRRLRSLGATIVVGSDAGISTGKPHDVLPHATRDLVAMGLTPPEILTTLTATAAGVCGVGDRKGRLARGYDADLLAVGGDPITDIDALHRTHFVMRGGRVLVS